MLKRILKNIARSLTRKQRRRRFKPLYLKKRRRPAEAGFILPTVAVVSMVVVLMTAAMTIRSFDRARNASNVRVSQAAAEAAAPAIARAKVKIEALQRDPALPSRTPSTQSLYNAIKYNSKFTFGDETRLKLGFDINQDNAITADNANIKNDETLTTAWRFPTDTNNNGRFDTYTLYGIYFRSPSVEAGNFNRERNPLEARTPPVNIPIANSRCADILNADTAILDNGWYQSSNKLNKSFFVYTASVPITDNTNLGDRFETLGGNTSFYALEYQQDRSLIPLNQYAVWFNNDLELSPTTDFRINGRIHTNGNLLVGGRNNATVRFYQVDSQDSCFYQPENGKITVGGNVGNGSVTDRSDRNVVTVDLYSNNPGNSTAQIGSNNKSTEETGGEEIAYSDDAFNQRLALMKQAALEFCIEAGRDCSELEPPEIKTVLAINKYPDEVKNRFSQRLQENPSLNTYIVLSEELERYLRYRTRRVPYAEVLESNNDILNDYTQDNIFANLNTIEPPAEWREPTDNNTRLLLRTRQLEATSPEQQLDGIERYLGDRIRVGNNLPAYWKDGNNYVTAPRDRQLIAGINWTTPNDQPRYRSTQVQPFDTSEIAERGGFWEQQAATNTGGLRIITGTGIYGDRKDNNSRIPALQVDSFLPDLSNRKLDSGADLPTPDKLLRIAGQPIDKYTLVWSDMMPMTGGDEEMKKQGEAPPPNLRMRATAVYHYTQSTGVDQIPIACVSSYYDPTDETTAKNGKFGTNNGYPWGAGGNPLPYNNDLNGRSNNGIVYEAPYTNNNDRIREIGIYLPELRTQAKMMFPNGRIVNQPLQNALKKLTANVTLDDPEKPLSISENATLDTAICALKILDGTIIPVNNNPIISHGAIQEASFLDGREIKAISRDEDDPSSSTLNSDRNPRYDLDLEQRQPLEIRVTDINLSTGEIRETYSDPKKEKVVGITRKKIDPSRIDSDYLLPNSGIVYASRDDALRDDSSAISSTSNSNSGSIVVQSSTDTSAIARLESQLLSPTDFKLDPTRRPNGIRLINGSDLSRDIDNRYRPEEKGLILVSNLPVYIKGDFNIHQTPLGSELEEFQETLDWSNWSNFYTRRLENLNPNFACRPGKPGCPDRDGDTWRSSTIIADTVTLLSNSFRDGFRNQGNYDLNNNTALPISQQTTPDNPQQATTEREKVSENRKKNGFWDNSFVTSSDWWDTNSSGNPYPNQKNSDDSYVSSYLTNGVTPIQRRTTFPEYVMEICRKIPVETCADGDWKIGYDENGDDILDERERSISNVEDDRQGGTNNAANRVERRVERLGAGTTARPALQLEDRRYPRRVAFLKQSGGTRSGNQPPNNQPPSNQPPNNQPPSNQPPNNQPPSNQQPSTQPPNNQPSNIQTPNNQPSNNQPPNNQQPSNQTPNNQPPNDRQSSEKTPIPLGINSDGRVQRFPYTDGTPPRSLPQGLPRQVPTALWFKTTTNPANPTEGESYSPNNPLFIKEISSGQPLLVPVLQIHSSDGSPSETLDRGNPNRYATNWLQTAGEDTTFNAVFMASNSPSRPQEESAGLPNFVRFLENWENRVVKIDGNFIQMRRSTYATAPFMPIRRDTATELATPTDNLSWFDYAINKYPTSGANNDLPTGTPPYYSEPERHWQFDVALLSQSSDLFAQEVTTPSTSQSSELLREVSRDDPWVQTLLCAAVASDRTGKITATYTQYAVSDKTQRPATCQNDTPDYPANLN